jgi:hypothetical protein
MFLIVDKRSGPANTASQANVEEGYTNDRLRHISKGLFKVSSRPKAGIALELLG